MDSPDLESLLNHFNERISTIQDLIPMTRLVEEQIKKDSSNIFYAPTGMTITAANVDTSVDTSRNGSDLSSSISESDVINDLQSMADLVQEMQTMVKEINESIESQKLSLNKQEERIKMRIGGLRAHLMYLKDNFKAKDRAVLPVVTAVVPKSATNGHEQQQQLTEDEEEETATIPIKSKANGTKKTTNGTVSKSSNGQTTTAKKTSATVTKNGTITRKKNPAIAANVPKVTELTQEEFDSVPGYQKGRLTMEVVNKSIDDFNKAMTAKYRLMSAPNRNTEAEIKRYQTYKSQENNETKGEYFVTSSDLKELSELKADNTTKLILQCLRHCKRIKEIRGPAKLIRFAVISNK